MKRFFVVTTSIFGLLAMQGFAARADEALDQLAKDPKQWVMQQGDNANTRFSKLNQINASNAGKLQVAWTFSTGVLRGHEGGPLVVGDTMYVHTPFPNTVYALDLNQDGKILWKYEPRQDPNVIPIMCCDTVNRGVAYADGKIFLHQADTTLVALDAKTGAKVWSVMDGEAGKGQSGTDAPFVFKDKVLVGVSGGEFGVRGWVSAYNIKDGKLVGDNLVARHHGDFEILAVDHIQYMVIGALIVVFLIVEPNGLARLWQIGKQKLRVWPFPY